jgi:hypothetical protein
MPEGRGGGEEEDEHVLEEQCGLRWHRPQHILHLAPPVRHLCWCAPLARLRGAQQRKEEVHGHERLRELEQKGAQQAARGAHVAVALVAAARERSGALLGAKLEGVAEAHHQGRRAILQQVCTVRRAALLHVARDQAHRRRQLCLLCLEQLLERATKDSDLNRCSFGAAGSASAQLAAVCRACRRRRRRLRLRRAVVGKQ